MFVVLTRFSLLNCLGLLVLLFIQDDGIIFGSSIKLLLSPYPTFIHVLIHLPCIFSHQHSVISTNVISSFGQKVLVVVQKIQIMRQVNHVVHLME